MELCSIPPAFRTNFLCCLLLVAGALCPAECDTEETKWEEPDGMQMESLSAQLSVTAQATPTPLWAVVWGPTQTLEDETHRLLSSQETDRWQASTDEAWPHHQSSSTTQTQQPPVLKPINVDGEVEEDPEEVDPQFYVTVTISSLLILTAIIITAKLCYDRSCSQHPPPLSRGIATPPSLAIPRSLPQEDSRQTLRSTPSFSDRERIPVVNL